jgi:hypothetical protein
VEESLIMLILYGEVYDNGMSGFSFRYNKEYGEVELEYYDSNNVWNLLTALSKQGWECFSTSNSIKFSHVKKVYHMKKVMQEGNNYNRVEAEKTNGSKNTK